MEIQLVISVITVIGSGISVYVGVRVAIAEIKGDIRRLDEAREDVSRRLDRLEGAHFNSRDH